jgi:hypothetical protein
LNPLTATVSRDRPTPPQVVFAPDLVGRALIDADAAAVLRLWRDDVLRPVLNRPLLTRYLKLFRGLGLGEKQIRRWAWWFTSTAKVTFVANVASTPVPLPDLCNDLVRQSGAHCVIHGGTLNLPVAKTKWLTASEFLAQGLSVDRSATDRPPVADGRDPATQESFGLK